MKNFKLTIQYDGSRYSGWQKQGNTKNTIQERFETLLSKMTGEEIEVHGSGRTDAGVHALGQIANFKCKGDFKTDYVKTYCNEYLPQDIRVIDVKEAEMRFHSRLNAISKHYRYAISKTADYDVFTRDFVANLPYDYDIYSMEQAASYLVGEHDFKHFCDNKHMKKSTIRNISQIIITESDEVIYIDFYGDGFLYHMVRLMTGALLEVGKGNLKSEDMESMILGIGEKPKLAPAKGLSLIKVFYE